MCKNIIIFTFVLLLIFSCKEQNQQIKLETIYTRNISTFIDTCWNEKDLLALNKIIDKNYSRVVNNVSIVGNTNELDANMKVYFTGFPNLSITIDKLVIKDKLGYLHWDFRGTNTGIFGEIPATGKKVFLKGFTILHFNKEGQIIHEEVYYNELDLLQQLGYTIKPPNTE